MRGGGSIATVPVEKEGFMVDHRLLHLTSCKRKSGEAKGLPRWFLQVGYWRYGKLTVVASPLLLMVNTPVAVLAVYVYADQPDGGFGTDAMNGPAA